MLCCFNPGWFLWCPKNPRQMSASSSGCLHAVDRQRDSKHESGSILSELCRAGTLKFIDAVRSRKKTFANVRLFDIFHQTCQQATLCENSMEANADIWCLSWVSAFIQRWIYALFMDRRQKKRVPPDLDFAGCYNWNGLLSAGTLVESRCCYVLVICFIWETEWDLILILFQACMFLKEATATMWTPIPVRKHKEPCTFRRSPLLSEG